MSNYRRVLSQIEVLDKHPERGKIRVGRRLLGKPYFYRGKRQDGVYEEWDHDGRIREYSEWHDGKEDGLFVQWHPNGNYSNLSSWAKGKLDGSFYLFWENGTLCELSQYDRGKQVGTQDLYWSDGKFLGCWNVSTWEPCSPSTQNWRERLKATDFHSLEKAIGKAFCLDHRPSRASR